MVQTEKAVLLKLFIFLCIYCFCSSVVVDRLMPLEIKSRHAFFSLVQKIKFKFRAEFRSIFETKNKRPFFEPD